jgi:cytochrome c-type biogenesis protein CcmH/NrfG
MREWQATLLAKADFPETQMAIGGVALALRNPAAGTRAFREAVVMDPQLVEGWIMIARISAALGDIEGAAASIDAGLAANPGNGALMQLHREIASVRQQ